MRSGERKRRLGQPREEGNLLDLNNLPEEHWKQPLEESSMTTAASADTAKRETETLNRARQLVFGNEGLPGACAFGLRDQGSFQYSVHPRLPAPTQHHHHHLYPSSSSHSLNPAYVPHYEPPPPHPPHLNNSYINNGQVLSGSSQHQMHHPRYGPADSSFTCYGAPLHHFQDNFH
ncbi:zinc finger protein STAMENLESS 1-like [Canna indica]|uniref:Zinc finger protein STAMENLESS 1-like n=1 Tax=Canna indica TaxID=4628 RepID=A0AAQ3Q9D9_9LILI|nr:zinc finger protein STAMENLESS 1-like [Canna indica]